MRSQPPPAFAGAKHSLPAFGPEIGAAEHDPKNHERTASFRMT